ncbi:MAG: hypothetical protein WCI75_07980 [candidate division NC10 bacterium]
MSILGPVYAARTRTWASSFLAITISSVIVDDLDVVGIPAGHPLRLRGDCLVDVAAEEPWSLAMPLDGTS